MNSPLKRILPPSPKLWPFTWPLLRIPLISLLVLSLMGETYSCKFAGCGKIFLRAYELKKHKATHEDPDSVFYCSQCNFITLQKKNLGIHFAIHTGEKVHQCTDIITIVGSSGSPACEERCKYKTNDPAALTKHRKKVHGYIPPPNRSRPTKAALASPYVPQKKKDGIVSQRPRPYQRPVSVPYCKPSHLSTEAKNSNSSAGYTSTLTESSNANVCSPFFWQGNVNTYGQSMNGNSFDVSGYDAPISSSATLVAPYVGTGLGTLHDASLYSEWMAKYGMSYGTFDATGMNYIPQPLQANPSPAAAGFYMQTGREGCLCPEWMVQAGIEGWDRSVLETHKEFYTYGA